MLKTYFIFTLGCQMNVSDSERIEAVLEKCGLKPTDEKAADLIIVNACSVRQKPIDRIWGKLRVWQKINPKAAKILTGCVLPSDLKKLEEKFDFCFKIDDPKDFSRWLQKSFSPRNLDKKKKTCHSEAMLKNLTRDPSPSAQDDSLIAYLPIMTGCDNFCSYCVVPYTRGRERSRKPKAVTKEVKCLVEKGYREIMLLGQNVCSYEISNKKSQISNEISNAKYQNNDFVELLEQLVRIPGNFKISFMSPHPKDFSDELIDLIAAEPKIAKQIHLPLQSGDDKILRKMNRHYTTKQYLSLVDKMRNAIFDLEISTDIIVGFSGESKKSFQNTVNLVKKCRFNKAYVSVYSPRSGTMAKEKYRDDVSIAEKKRRWLVLENLINKS